jgi:hypothetical protein
MLAAALPASCNPNAFRGAAGARRRTPRLPKWSWSAIRTRCSASACAIVAPRPGETVTLAEIAAYLRHLGIATFKLPERLEIRGKLPRNPLGKVLKRDFGPNFVNEKSGRGFELAAESLMCGPNSHPGAGRRPRLTQAATAPGRCGRLRRLRHTGRPPTRPGCLVLVRLVLRDRGLVRAEPY